MRDLLKNLTKRISSEYCLGQKNAETKASELYLKCPDKLKENLYQWAEEKPLQDIFVDKYSVPMIMAIWGNRDFIGAVDVLTEYMTGDRDIAERRIWRMRG